MKIFSSLLTFALLCIASVYSYTIGLKALVLHTQEDETFQNTIYGLESYGIPFDAFIINNTDHILTGNLSLYDEEGNPKYYLVILISGKLSSETADKTFTSSLSDEQWAYLDAYEQTFNVRRVTFSDTPESITGTSIYDASTWGNTYIQKIVGADNEIANEIYKRAGIKKDAPIATNNNFYHTPVTITNPDIATPVFYFEACEKIKERTVGAIYAKLEDGRERLSFFLPTASWSLDTIVLNHLWIHWGTRSIYNGIRRVTFSPHIDDVFISTNCVSTESSYESGITLGSESFRISKADLDDYLKFKDEILKKMPAGSSFNVDLAINGNGLLPVGDQLQVDGNRYVTLDYVKPMGEGMNNWPVEHYVPNWTDEYLAQDDLFQYFKNKENRSKFFWCSHTFTHENLDNASRSDVDNEIRVNIEMAKKLDLINEEWWSGRSIITPQISGLHSGDALEIFREYGIVSATGDISRADITNNSNPYLPFITTKGSSHVENFPIIPRSPTEIYFYASTPEEDTYIYNYMYHSYFGSDSTWEQILQRESTRALRLIMLLRHEAHQFHQANMRSDDSNEHQSLLQRWVEAVVNEYTKYADWPLVSLKLDDLNQLSIDRYNAEQCHASYKILVKDGYATEILINNPSEHDCVLPITVPDDVVRQSEYKFEQLGNDPLTVWVKVGANEESITLSPPLKWNPAFISSPATSTTTTKATTTAAPQPTTQPATQPTTPPATGDSTVYRHWFDDFFATDWYSCGNVEYECKQLKSDQCYAEVNQCWIKVPWPESGDLCNEMNVICAKIWTYVKEEKVNQYEDFFAKDWNSCGVSDWTCKTDISNECYAKARECWNQPWSEEVNEICNKMNAVCARIWL